MLFPVSNIEVSPFIPPLVAFCISCCTSMGGVSGAVLLLPFQVSVLGVTSPSVSATNQFFNVVATPAGIYRFIREQRMLWPLTIIIAIGTLPGLIFGALIRLIYLPDVASFKLFAGAVLLYVGGRFVYDLVRRKKGGGSQKSTAVGQVQVTSFTTSRLAFTYKGEEFSCSCLGVTVLSLVVGLLGGIYGIGGGAIMAPFLVSMFRLPVHCISGSTLSATFLTSVGGVAIYTLLSPYFPGMSVAPDWALGALLGLGGVAGMYCGARMQKFVPDYYIRWGLACVLLGTALSYVLPALL